MRSSLQWGLLSLILLSSCGGSSGDYSGPVGQVQGVVNLGDGPLTENATVNFLALKEGFAMSAALKDDGVFKLKFNGSNDVPVGTYRVSVSPTLPENTANLDPKSYFNKDGTTKKMEKLISKVPARYRQTGTSDLNIVVKEGKQKLDIDLDLK